MIEEQIKKLENTKSPEEILLYYKASTCVW